MDCVDIQGGGARSIDCFILFAWQTGDLMWLVSRRSVSDGARRDCYRWQDTDTSQSLAVNLSCSASTTCSTSEPYLKILRVQCIISLRPPKKSRSLTRDFKLAGGPNARCRSENEESRCVPASVNPRRWRGPAEENTGWVSQNGERVRPSSDLIWGGKKQNGCPDNPMPHYCCLRLSCQNGRQGYVKFRVKGSSS